MPIYEFQCATCGAAFEQLAKLDERPPCPTCGAERAERVMSTFSLGRAPKPVRPHIRVRPPPAKVR